MARELDTDESEESFDRVLKKVIGNAHPKGHAPPAPRKEVQAIACGWCSGLGLFRRLQLIAIAGLLGRKIGRTRLPRPSLPNVASGLDSRRQAFR